MTDEPTPDSPKIPPKLTVRPAAEPVAKTDADSSGPPTARHDTQKPAPATVKTAAAAAEPVAKTDADSSGPPTARHDTQKPASADAHEAPTLILQKQPASSDKSKTSRIPLDAALTSRISDAMGAEDSESAAVPKTIRLSRPPATKSASPQAAAPQPVQMASPAKAPPPAQEGGAPRTIRLQRPGDAPTVPVMRKTEDGDEPVSKRKTSRISLDAVLQADGKGDGEGASATGIKTIRLKRPTDGTAPKVAVTPPVPAAGDADETAEEQSAKSRTSRLDLPTSSATDAAPPTQRKTIRIKRPDGTTGAKPARTLSLARGKQDEDAEPASAEAAQDETAPAADTGKPKSRDPGIVFALTAIAAALVAAVLLYVLMAQAFPGAGFSWPGQVGFNL